MESGIEVICVGLPRTGTKSLSLALEILLGGPAFHGSRLEHFDQHDIDFWVSAVGGQPPSSKDWVEYLKNEKSCLDYPFIVFYQDLMKAFPNAKIIVTQRDPDSWYDSWWSSIGLTLNVIETQPMKFVISFLQHPKIKFIHETARSIIPKGCSMSLDTAFQSREKAAQFYEEWMTEVFSKIPPEDLLVYDVKQGWDPLCRFLNIPVPNVPFPRVNESADIQTAIRNMKVFSWTAALGIPILTLGLGYFVWKMLK